MTTRIQAALTQLNAALAGTGRQYQVQQRGDQFVLVIPTGGTYPATDANAMVVRLVNLKLAAVGREAR